MRATPVPATLAACVMLIGGCGSSTAAGKSATTPVLSATAPTPTTAADTAPKACEKVARKELVSVAKRIYSQAVSGRNEAASVARLGRSTRLSRAVQAGRPAAVQAALTPLIKHQITAIRIESLRGKVLATYGTAAAYAPASGDITRAGVAVGRFVLSVSDDRAYTSLVHGLTGVTATFGPTRVPAATASIDAMAFPAGRQVISLAIPPLPRSLCARSAAETRLATIGYVGQRLVDDEEHGPGAIRSIKHAQRSPAFRAAILADNAAGVRAAIIGFFQDSRYHVVRVRAWNARHVINDVGGPFVMDPAVGVIHASGAVAGHFMLAIQDDTGYIKLMHRFTGARVVLHAPTGTVPGSNLEPGPPFTPGLTSVSYHGTAYHSDGFTATAFPDRTLGVSLLVR